MLQLERLSELCCQIQEFNSAVVQRQLRHTFWPTGVENIVLLYLSNILAYLDLRIVEIEHLYSYWITFPRKVHFYLDLQSTSKLITRVFGIIQPKTDAIYQSNGLSLHPVKFISVEKHLSRMETLCDLVWSPHATLCRYLQLQLQISTAICVKCFNMLWSKQRLTSYPLCRGLHEL